MTLPNGTYLKTCGLRFVFQSRSNIDGECIEHWVLGTDATVQDGIMLKSSRGNFGLGETLWYGVIDDFGIRRSFKKPSHVIRYLRKDLKQKALRAAELRDALK